MVESIVTLLYKKGDPSNIGNFRPISLLTVTMKSITKVILNRIESSLEEAESHTQTGFRKGLSVLNNLQSITQLTERCNEYEIPIYLACVDFTKAFDCVEWSSVWNALWDSGTNPTLIHMLRRIYEKSSTKVKANEDMISIEVKRRGRQGDTLSPRLFNLVLRSAMHCIDWEEVSTAEI